MPKHGGRTIGRGGDPNAIKTEPEDRPPTNYPVPEEPFVTEQNGDTTIVRDASTGKVVGEHSFQKENGGNGDGEVINEPPFDPKDPPPNPTLSPQNRQVSQRPRQPPPIRGFQTLVAAPVGFGKSTFASKFPGPIMLIIDENDRGILDQIAIGRIPSEKFIFPDDTATFGCPIIKNSMTGWMTINRYLGDLEKAITASMQSRGRRLEWGEEVTFKMDDLQRTFTMPRTILIESMSGIQTACFDYILFHDFQKDAKAFDNYGAGSRKAGNKEWPIFLRKIAALREFGIDVIFTCHTDITPDDTERVNHKVQVPKLNKVTLGSLIKDCNMSLQMILDVEFDQIETDKKTGVKSGKAEREAPRKLICNPSPVYKHCKNHFGMPDMVLPDDPDKLYEAVCKAAKFDPKTFRPARR